MPRKRSTPKPASPSPLQRSDEPTDEGGSEGRGEGKQASPLNKGGPRGVRPSALLDTRIIYCADCLDHESEPRPSGSGFLIRFEDRHASTQAYIDYMRPRCVISRWFVRSSRKRLGAPSPGAPTRLDVRRPIGYSVPTTTNLEESRVGLRIR